MSLQVVVLLLLAHNIPIYYLIVIRVAVLTFLYYFAIFLTIQCLLQEHHLQRALSAQQVYGTSEALVIPVPDIDDIRREYEHTYPTDYKPPRQYIHAQPLGVDQVGLVK